jgi:pimeloyl-ACP methyl ester carboxylesterase
MHELADEHWLIAPDIPGFGFTEDTEPYTFPHLIEWLAAFCYALRLPRTAVIGHSFGGMLATAFALSYPEDVTRLLLLAPAILVAQNWPQIPVRWSISMGLVDVGSAVTQKPPLVQRTIRVPFYDVDGQHGSVWERRMRDYENARSSADVIKALAGYDIRPLLARWQQPVTLVWGEKDQIVPAANARILQQLWPQAEVHILPKCGHVPMIEKQHEFQAITQEFLTRHGHLSVV